MVDNDSPSAFAKAIRPVVASPNTKVESVRPSGYEIGALQVGAALAFQCKVPPKYTMLLQHSTPLTRRVNFESEMVCGMMMVRPEKNGGWGVGYVGELQRKKEKGDLIEPHFKGVNGSFVGVLFDRASTEYAEWRPYFEEMKHVGTVNCVFSATRDALVRLAARGVLDPSRLQVTGKVV